MPSDNSDIALVVGLGNPGLEYEQTRHNIGFMMVDYLASKWNIKLSAEKRFHGIYGENKGGNHKVRLLKPTTFMNASGQAVRACRDWYKLNPQSILVVYDDMDLPIGKIRLRMSGSSGGHNGMKSIIAHLGTQEFTRLRLGIGRENNPNKSETNPIAHVLGSFSAMENSLLPDLFDLSMAAIASINSVGIAKTMSIYNSRTVSVDAT